jgi:AcrR family transcriptional regulator
MAAMSVGEAPVRSAVRAGGSTADRILGAALTAFATRGVEATSLDSVASAIGIRKQTILYWFPSKEALLFAVIDEAVAELGALLTEAVLAVDTLAGQVAAAVDATFRLGRTRPELLALVREVARVGPPALTHLGAALEPLVDTAASAIAGSSPAVGRAEARRLLVEAGAGVVGLATEAEMRAALGDPPGIAWLRRRRGALLVDLQRRLA